MAKLLRTDVEDVLAVAGSGLDELSAKTEDLSRRTMQVIQTEPDIEVRIAAVNRIEMTLASERARR